MGRPRGPLVCGTRNGYRTHLRRQETPCDECRAANTEWQRHRRAAEKGLRDDLEHDRRQ